MQVILPIDQGTAVRKQLQNLADKWGLEVKFVPSYRSTIKFYFRKETKLIAQGWIRNSSEREHTDVCWIGLRAVYEEFEKYPDISFIISVETYVRNDYAVMPFNEARNYIKPADTSYAFTLYLIDITGYCFNKASPYLTFVQPDTLKKIESKLLSAFGNPVNDSADASREMDGNEFERFVPISTNRSSDSRIVSKVYSIDEVRNEQASQEHQRLVLSFANYFNSVRIYRIRRGRVDLMIFAQNVAMIFEMKSLTEDNERKQTRLAIGQLSDYEFVECAEFRDRLKIMKSVVFERRPSDNVISWLRFSGHLVFWLDETGNIIGERESVEKLQLLKSL